MDMVRSFAGIDTETAVASKNNYWWGANVLLCLGRVKLVQSSNLAPFATLTPQKTARQLWSLPSLPCNQLPGMSNANACPVGQASPNAVRAG